MNRIHKNGKSLLRSCSKDFEVIYYEFYCVIMSVGS